MEEKEVPLHSLPLADTFSSSDITELPPLSQEMQEVINRAEGSGEEEILVDAHKIQITVKDINTLKGLEWLNDEVINFYMQVRFMSVVDVEFYLIFSR